MEKRKLHHYLTRLRAVPHWGLFIAAIALLVVAVLALRANNRHMIQLREAVFVADEQDGDIEGALKELREYVYAHMNTNLSAGGNAIKPPIQLKYQYERLVLAENAKMSSGNEAVYTGAQAYCERTVPNGFSGRYRLDCIKAYVDSHGVQSKPVQIPEALYKFDFIAPAWSPDLAGLSLVLAALCFFFFCLLMLSELLIRRNLKSHHH